MASSMWSRDVLPAPWRTDLEGDEVSATEDPEQTHRRIMAHQ
jgi:hypothetical protein